MQVRKPERLLCLYLPHFRAQCEAQRQVVAAEEEPPALIVYRGELRPTVVDASAQAAEQGVYPGMLLARAQSHAPEALAVPQDEPFYQARSQALVDTLWQLTPEVHTTELDALVVAVRGLEALVGDEQAVARRVLQIAQQAGYQARVLVSGTRLAARLLVEQQTIPLAHLSAESERTQLARLSLDVLPANPPEAQGKLRYLGAAWREMLRRLRLLGMRQLGDVLKLGRVALQAQFGPVGLHLWRVLQGEDLPPEALEQPLCLEVQQQCDPPLDNWLAIDAALEGLSGELLAQLQQEGLVCTHLDVHWQTLADGRGATDGAVEGLALKSGDSGYMAATAQRVLRQELSLSARQSLEELGLRAHGYLPEEGAQASLFATQAQREAPLKRLAAELQERFGRPTLLRAEYVGPHLLEERVYRFRAV